MAQLRGSCPLDSVSLCWPAAVADRQTPSFIENAVAFKFHDATGKAEEGLAAVLTVLPVDADLTLTAL
jgi:hypothetical protein